MPKSIQNEKDAGQFPASFSFWIDSGILWHVNRACVHVLTISLIKIPHTITPTINCVLQTGNCGHCWCSAYGQYAICNWVEHSYFIFRCRLYHHMWLAISKLHIMCVITALFNGLLIIVTRSLSRHCLQPKDNCGVVLLE